MILLAAIALPLAAGLLALVVPPRLALWLTAAAALGARGLACLLGAESRAGIVPGFFGYLRADGLAIVLTFVVSAAAATAALVGVRYFVGGGGPAHDARRYAVVASLLHAALLCTCLADHLGLMWISMELAAVLATVLIALHGDRLTLEAAFKYMMLGSASLVLSLLATALVYRAGLPAIGEGDAALFVIVGVAAVGLKDHVGLA